MRNNRQFVSWMLVIGLLIVGGGHALGMVAVLATPEPMPKLSHATEDSITAVSGWYNKMVRELEYERSVANIEFDAEFTMFGFSLSTIQPNAKCGSWQLDVDPYTGRIIG